MRREKIVYECKCDVCDKDIPSQGKHYVVRLTAGSWVNDNITEELEKDLCSDCYNTLKDLINLDNGIKSNTKKLSRKGEKHRRVTNSEILEAEKMYLDGKSFAEIGRKLHMSENTIKYQLKKLPSYEYAKKKHGKKEPLVQVKKTSYGASYKTVVAPNGMVESVEVLHG